MLHEGMGRREFLKRAAQAAAAAVVSGGIGRAAVPEEKNVPLSDTIPTRALGKTGVELPILGYGGAALPTAWGNPLSYEDRAKLVRYAYDRGVRYFDTAGNYLESQWILGRALKDVRNDVYLATKVETTVPGQVRKAVEKSLEELKTDYLDVIQIHGTPGIEQMSVAQAMKIHGELLLLRQGAGLDLHRRVRPLHAVVRVPPERARSSAFLPNGRIAQCLRGESP